MKARALELARDVVDTLPPDGAVTENRVVNRNGWRDMVRSHLEGLDVAKLREDVAPFLQNPSEAELLTAEHLGHILDD